MVAVIVCVLVGVALFLVAIVPVITDQVASITDQAPDWLDQLQHNQTVQDVDEEYDVIDKVRDYVTGGDFVGTLFGGALGVGLAVLGALFNALHHPGADAVLPLLARDHQVRRSTAWPPPRAATGSPGSATGSSRASAATSPARSWSPCAPGSRR